MSIAEAKRRHLDAPPEGATPARRSDGRSHRGYVLVVEDDQDLADVVAMSLEAMGYVVKVARDGREGLETARLEMPALVLLDMLMPVMDGWVFARSFRETLGTRTPIVVMTAADSALGRAEEIGACGFLAKPFQLDALLAVVERFVVEDADI